uniref:Uncharacterized protein n=1 Tax=Gadus morhua TaxID=8049 RepID=A0A8C5FTR2_GADMO
MRSTGTEATVPRECAHLSCPGATRTPPPKKKSFLNGSPRITQVVNFVFKTANFAESFHPFFSLSLFSLTGRRYTHLQQRAVQSTSHTRVHENLADSQLAGGVSECVCAIACLYLLWKRERRRRCTELLAVILYNYIILYTIIYRAPGVANGNNHFLLHAAVHPGLHCTEAPSTRTNLSRHKSS